MRDIRVTCGGLAAANTVSNTLRLHFAISSTKGGLMSRPSACGNRRVASRIVTVLTQGDHRIPFTVPVGGIVPVTSAAKGHPTNVTSFTIGFRPKKRTPLSTHRLIPGGASLVTTTACSKGGACGNVLIIIKSGKSNGPTLCILGSVAGVARTSCNK